MSETNPSSAATPANPVTAPPSSPAPANRSRGPGTLQLGIVVAILAVGILLTALTSDVTRMSEAGIRLVNDYPSLPETAGTWKGGEQTGLTEDERKVLPADTEGVRRIYTDANGHMVFLSVVLAGRDVTSIHRPELCLTGQGWQLEAARTEHLEAPAAKDNEINVSRLNASNTIQLSKGGTAQAYAVFVYWFVGKDRTTPYHWQRILWTTEDRVLHNRNHRWAYFLVNAMASPEVAARDPKAAQDQAMQVVRGFVKDIYPQLTAQ